jgi:hypothetical protein
MGIHGTFENDPWHRCWDDLLNATTAAGLSWQVVNGIFLWNLGIGPWEGMSFYQELRSTASRFFATCDTNNVLFQALYPDIVRDLKMHSIDEGTPEHMARVFEAMKTCTVFHRRGKKVKKKRFMSWIDEGIAKLPESSVLLLVLLFRGIQMGWWTSFADCPLIHAKMAKADSEAVQEDGDFLVGVGDNAPQDRSTWQRRCSQIA